MSLGNVCWLGLLLFVANQNFVALYPLHTFFPGLTVQALMEPRPAINSDMELERTVEKLVKSTAIAIEQHTPLVRPSPYSKQWFTPELKSQ
jgi:hypothetical protein